MKRCMFVDDSAVIRKVAKRILGAARTFRLWSKPASGTRGACNVHRRDARHHRRRRRFPDMYGRRIHPPHPAPSRQPIKPADRAFCLTEVDIGAIMRAKRAGAQGYLLKPFNRSQLLERFRQLQSACGFRHGRLPVIPNDPALKPAVKAGARPGFFLHSLHSGRSGAVADFFRLAQHIAAAPDGLDVVLAAGCGMRASCAACR